MNIDDKIIGSVARGRGLFVAASFGTAILALLSGCGGGNANFRYRLAITVEINGVVKTASSIVNVYYYWGDSVEASGARGFSTVKGVAPVIELGQGYGWLVAALNVNYVEYARRKKALGVACPQPKTAAEFGQVFAETREALDRLSSGKRDLPANLLPAFIWFPAGASYKQAQQICPEEFYRAIGANVRIRSVSVEVARDAPVLKRLEIKAPWLDEIRVDQGVRHMQFGDAFEVGRQSQLETDNKD